LSEERLKYIYNIDQADYYIKEGCIALGAGRHPQTKNVFLIFNFKETQSAYEKWCKKCVEYKKSNIMWIININKFNLNIQNT